MEKKKNSSKKTTTSKKTASAKIVKAETKEEVVKDVAKVETKKSNHGTFKVLAIVILVVALLTWFIKSGTWSYNANDAGQTVATFTANEEPVRTGINELFLAVYYAINYYLIQIVFLAILGIFYGVISRTKGYKVMVKKTASLFKKKETLFMIITSLLIALLASFTTQPIVALIFIPMLYSVAKELKINKVSAMLATYGALAVGVMGVTFGTYGINYGAQNLGLEIANGVGYRAVILVLGYLLLNGFIVFFNKKTKKAELVEDNFELADDESKGKAWPYFLIFGLLLVFAILGYVAWQSSFNIDVFNNFHEWLTTKVVIGEKQTPIIAQILGNVTAFGTWDPYTISYIMIIIVIFVKFFARIKWDDVCEYAVAGLKKVAKPIVLITMAYTIFVIIYWSGITTPIVDFLNKGDAFNPYLSGLGNAIADFLHVDVEYTGFALGQFYATKFASNTEQIMAIMSATSGLVAFIAPTSVFMLIGLSMSKLSYKDYFKAIWKFLAALVVVLLIIFTVITYI